MEKHFNGSYHKYKKVPSILILIATVIECAGKKFYHMVVVCILKLIITIANFAFMITILAIRQFS